MNICLYITSEDFPPELEYVIFVRSLSLLKWLYTILKKNLRFRLIQRKVIGSNIPFTRSALQLKLLQSSQKYWFHPKVFQVPKFFVKILQNCMEDLIFSFKSDRRNWGVQRNLVPCKWRRNERSWDDGRIGKFERKNKWVQNDTA